MKILLISDAADASAAPAPESSFEMIVSGMLKAAEVILPVAETAIPGAQLLPMINMGLSLAEKLLPAIHNLHLSGQISAAEQADLLARFNRLRAKADGQFSGPEWQIVP